MNHYEKIPPAHLPQGIAARLSAAIEDAVVRALHEGWNAEQVRSEVEYAIETAPAAIPPSGGGAK